MSTNITAPFPLFVGLDGLPLNDGYIYIGAENQNPETAPINVYWDSALTIPAVQPLRTRNGYFIRSGSATNAYVGSNFSIAVRDNRLRLVTTSASVSDFASLLASGPGSSLVGYQEAGTGAIARTVQTFLRELCVNVKDYGAVGDGSTNDSAAFQAAFDAANGRKVYAPAGTYRLNTGVSNITAGGVFTKGLSLIGDGPDKTIIDFRGSTQAINIDTDTTLEFQMFVRFEQLKIVGSSATGTADGIRLRRAYMVTLDHVWITGFPGDGIAIVMNEGDADGSNMVHMRQCRIENCRGWGINGEVTGSYNEFSFLLLEHVFIQSCGTVSASTPPPSGGIRWKGQVLHALDSAVVICENVGIFLQGGSGLANTATLTNFVLENNTKRGLYCTGIDGLTWDRGQLYNNDSYTATRLVEFDGSSSTVRGIEINGLIVRATSGNNACTAFKISGANVDFNTCRVRGTIWQNFDYAGQARFDGWQFDHVTQFCKLVALTSTSVILRPDQNYGGGATTPIRLRGANAGGSAGEWVALTLANTGISATNSGLSANQRYYVYLYDNANSYELRFSGTAFVIDTATGYPVKSGDTSQLYVGSVETDGSSLFKLTAGGWLNPTPISGNQVGAPAYLWRDGSGQLRMKYASLPTSDTDGTVIGP
jgi:hypothetical protein